MPNEYKSQKRKVTMAFCLLLMGLSLCRLPAQEIRRAIPVVTPTPGTPVEIRRALPVQPPTFNQPAPAPATPTPTPAPPLATPYPSPPAPIVSGGSVNDTARFLAGLPLSPDSPLFPLTQEPEWQHHASYFNRAWEKLNALQFTGIHNWQANYFPEASGPLPVVYYLFSGPDFLYAHQFYPHASTYILAGTEPIGPLPEVGQFAGPLLAPTLHSFETSLNSVLNFSFFITKDMKTDLQNPALKGTLPIFYVFLARAGKVITDISFISLDRKGNPQIGQGNSHALTPGVRISFKDSVTGEIQTLYYFTTDLSNDGIHSHPGFMKFCAAQGLGYSLLKSASYLMFEGGFSTVREFLLTHSRAIIEDDSGIPIGAFDPAKWNIRLFGSYSGPIDIFKQYYQPQLQTLFQSSNPAALSFGIGYHWRRSESSLILALHR